MKAQKKRNGTSSLHNETKFTQEQNAEIQRLFELCKSEAAPTSPSATATSPSAGSSGVSQPAADSLLAPRGLGNASSKGPLTEPPPKRRKGLNDVSASSSAGAPPEAVGDVPNASQETAGVASDVATFGRITAGKAEKAGQYRVQCEIRSEGKRQSRNGKLHSLRTPHGISTVNTSCPICFTATLCEHAGIE